MSDPRVTSFCNHVLADWDEAMDRFFERVSSKQEARELSDAEVRSALVQGYGDEVADAWDEWCGVTWR